MTEPFIPDRTPVDFFLLDGKASPGVAKFKGLDAPRKWEELTAPGLGGAMLRFMGNKICNFSALIYLQTDQDWIDYHAFLPLLLRTPQGQRPKALSFWHPYAAMLGIKSVEVESVSAPDEIPEGHLITVNLKEHNKLKPQFSKPAEPKAPNAPTDPNDIVIEAQRKRLAQLNEENERLGATP